METITGRVTGVNGNLIKVSFQGSVRKNEVGYVVVDDKRLKGEVIRIANGEASMQIYEMTQGIKVGDPVEFTGELMSVELGPGLLTQVYDGLQNPLPDLAKKCGFFLERGVYLNPIPDRAWDFTPAVKVGDQVEAGDTIGSVPEGIFVHQIMVPFITRGTWTVKSIKAKGSYNVRETICVIENDKGEEKELSMVFSHPIKQAVKCYEERLRPDEPLVTKIRCIDAFLPVAKGGTFCVPGPFGAGKTVLQHLEAKNAEADVVIVAACGERAGEVVEVLTEFPELEDPKTGRSLMERTIIICNTSSMPVAAREASCYTAVTLAEYYRQMGLDVLLLADSTSRWAQAMREMSGRLEEMPGEEGYPAYLGSRLAQFYERAGRVEVLGHEGLEGALSVIGAVSPPGGDISEPVSQATLRIVKVFWGLDSALAYKRHFPAINWLTSYSLYADNLGNWFNTNVNSEWTTLRTRMMGLLSDEASLDEIVKLVGMDALSATDRLKMEAARSIREDFLHQLAFHEIDTYSSLKKQYYMMSLVLAYYDKANAALEMGADIEKLVAVPSREAIGRFKYVLEENIDSEFEKTLSLLDDDINEVINAKEEF